MILQKKPHGWDQCKMSRADFLVCELQSTVQSTNASWISKPVARLNMPHRESELSIAACQDCWHLLQVAQDILKYYARVEGASEGGSSSCAGLLQRLDASIAPDTAQQLLRSYLGKATGPDLYKRWTDLLDHAGPPEVSGNGWAFNGCTLSQWHGRTCHSCLDTPLDSLKCPVSLR